MATQFFVEKKDLQFPAPNFVFFEQKADTQSFEEAFIRIVKGDLT